MGSSILDRVLSAPRLPSPPATAMRILELANQPDSSVEEVARAVAADPSISARLLKYANSPLVGLRQPVTSIRHAVTLLGVRAVKVAALSFSLVRKQDSSRCPGFDFNLYWAYAAASATAARGIAAATRPDLTEEAFVAGLLARIGKLAFAMALPTEYDAVLTASGGVLRAAAAEERAAFGCDHIELGAALLAKWKLPALLVETARHQATPSNAPEGDVRSLANAIQHGCRIADVLCGLRDRETAGATAMPGPRWDELEHQFRDLAAVLDISLDKLPDPDELEGRARELVEEMSVAAQAENEAMLARQDELVKQTLIDALTGIGNRRAFDERLASELERARRLGRPLALLMVDIDRFKRVNDCHGHVVGDAALKGVADRIRESVRSVDFAARYGGEEFAVIARETGRAAAAGLAERVRRAVAARPVSTPAGELTITVSIGGVVVSASSGAVEQATVVAAADARLYQAKEAGRDRCCVADFVGAPPPAATLSTS